MTHFDYGNRPLMTIAIPIETETARQEYERVLLGLVHAQMTGLLTPGEAQRLRDDYEQGFLPPEGYAPGEEQEPLPHSFE